MASLTIDLDDQATDGLADIDAALDQMAQTSLTTAKSADMLTASQQRQLVVIQQQTSSFSQLANTGLHAFGELGAAGVHAFGEIAAAAEMAAAKSGLLTKGAAIATTTTALVGQSAGWKSLGKAAEYAGVTGLKALTGLGPQVAGVTVGLKGLEAVMSRTGVQMTEMADGSQKLQSNWDRISTASGKLSASVSRDFSEAGDAVKEMMSGKWFDLSFGLWDQLDKSATRSAENIVENIGHLNKGYNDSVMALRTFAFAMDDVGIAAYTKEVKAIRELQDWHVKMDKQRALEKDGFAMLGRANEELAGRQEYRAEQARLASLKTIDAIYQEEEATRKAAVLTAQAGKFDADAKEEYYKKMDTLEQRRTAVEKAESDKRKEFHRTAREDITEEMRLMQEHANAHNAIYDAEQKKLLQRAGLVKELAALEAKQAQETGVAAAKDMHGIEKDAHSERMKGQGATESQIKSDLADMDKQFAEADHKLKLKNIDDEAREKFRQLEIEREKNEKTGGTLAERRKRDIEIQAEAEKSLADRQKKMMAENGRFAREINHLDLADKAQVEQAKFAIERERIGKLKAMQDAENEKLKAKFDGKAFGQAQDPRKVLKALQDQRADEAKTKQSARDEDMGRDAMGGDKSALKKFESNQRQMMAAARRKAAEDFNNGNVGDGEMQKAQSKVGEQTLGTLQKQGKLNQGQQQVLTDALKALADQQQSLDNQQQTLNQLMANAKGQKEVARQTVKATQNQQGSLN